MMIPVDRCVFPPNTHDKIPTQADPPPPGSRLRGPASPKRGLSRSRCGPTDLGITVTP